MNRTARLIFVIAIATSALSLPSVAQVADPPTSDQVSSLNEETAPGLTLMDVEAALAAVEEDSGIEGTVKGALRAKFQQAIAALKDAGANSEKATEFRQALSQAPVETAKLREQLQELPAAENAVEIAGFKNLEDFQRELDGKRAALASLNEQLSSVTAELNAEEGRPADISVRIPDAQRELAEVRQQLPSGDDASAGSVADRYLLQAQEAQLLSELDALKQEQLSMSVRRILQQTKKELLSRQVENASATVAAYEELMDKSVTKQSQIILARAAELKKELSDGHPALELVTEVQDLAKELASTLQDKEAISDAKANATARLERLVQEQEGISKQLELGQPDREMAEVLLKLRDLLNSRERELAQEPSWPSLSQTRLAAVLVDAAIARQKDVQAKFAEKSSNAVEELIAARDEVLEKLRDQYLELLPELASLETERRLYSDKVKEVQDLITKQLFWMRISPSLSAQNLGESPPGLLWALSPTHGRELARSMWEAIGRSPIASAAVLLIAFSLLLMRPIIGAALKRAGEGVGRVSKDHFGLTRKAALWTILLALPIPLLVAFFALTLAQPDASLDWQTGIRVGLRLMAPSIFAAFAAAACCYPGGLGQKHFGWRTEVLDWLRRGSHWFLVVYIPLAFLTFSTLFSKTAEYIDSIGRVSFILAHIWLTIFLGRLFYSSKGIHATISGKNAFVRLGNVLAIACPIGLVTLACSGYTIAALKLSYLFSHTLSIVFCTVILYSLALRWFKIEHRRMALAEAIERRRVRMEAASAEEQQEDSDEVISVDEDDQELDIDTIDDQTRHLLRLLFGLGTATAVLSLWSETLPLVEYFESVRIPMMTNLTLLDATKASLVVGITWIAIKNLPGVLEFAILRSTSIHAGTRNAITTIGQYAVIAIGLILLFTALKLDWTQFGWIAGGLSVGIGFGLQEVVANFVCGLILLFERPIRVGDVVTVEGEIGTVTKIHLRATTITNFDRGEVVLPNKTLITSKLVNWTLSSSLNRVAIPVGIAYGTDTETARRILLELAAEHPNVSADPPPMAIFNEFADSSLNILLRVYLPDRSCREATISELHTEIYKRFAAAGIEIPFPQRDFHLRSGWEAVSRDANEMKHSAI